MRTNYLLESTTATSLYPTHAAIETTPSSLLRGDWGLKHSLPSRSIGATSTPLVRIGHVESIDHITEFESAADLTMTLRKFQEFELPITRPQKHSPQASRPRLLGPAVSVFEDRLDNIQAREGDMTLERWKFNGPSLARETEKGFQKYIKKEISGRKSAFRQFLRKQLAHKELSDRREKARDEGEDVPQDPVEITDQRLDDYIKSLRQNPKELHPLIELFLDLPRVTGRMPGNSYEDSHQIAAVAERNDAVHGPPMTHPSAGLSYLRASSRVYNHPLCGPLELARPIQARFLTPQQTAGGKRRSRAQIGIGGIVADDSKTASYLQGQPAGSTRFDPETNVGNKYWFHPERATVASSGRIQLHLQRAVKATVSLHNGLVDEAPISKDDPARSDGYRMFPELSDKWSQRRSSSTQGYGLEDEPNTSSQLSSNGRVRPVDLKEGGTGMDEASMMLNLGRGNEY